MDDLYTQSGTHFFAASNTKEGFISYFDKIFDENECDKVYIIKGGPGCGKSTFMKKLGLVAEANGFHPEYFHCSSDPSSLDGIIIKEKKTAVIDGTNPHTLEPKFAGAREIIIDLGAAWNTDKLYENIKEIKRLSLVKSNCYYDCYRFLNSKSVMESLVYNLIFQHIFFDKLDRSALRLSKKLFGTKQKNTKGESKIRITEAMSGLGKTRFYSFEKMSDYCIFLKEPFEGCRLAHMFMSAVHEYAKKSGFASYVSKSSDKKDEINALYFPDIKTSISLFDESIVNDCDRKFKRCKIVNCARFLDTKAISHTKPLRKFYCKLSENMEKQALESLELAGKAHADTEKIYRQCTCYKTVEKITSDYIKKIIGT